MPTGDLHDGNAETNDTTALPLTDPAATGTTAAASGPEIIGDRYEIRRRVPRADGTVTAIAQDLLDACPVSVEFRDFDGESTDAIQRLRTAASNMAAVDHTSIVKIRDVLPYGTGIAVVSEAVSGRDLTETIATGPLGVADAARIGHSVALVLAAAHGAGMSHGALTPHDVIVGDAGMIYVANLAVRPSGLTVRSPMVEAVYAAPDQLTGRPPSASGDVYSLGVVLYELVVGHPPFAEWDAPLVADRKANEVAPRVADAVPLGSGRFDQLVAAMLQREPTDRPSAEQAAVVLSELMHAEPRAPLAATPQRATRVVTTETETYVPPERDNRFWIGLAVLLGVVLVGVLAWAFTRDGNDDRVSVPTVVGQPAVQALARLENREFDVSTIELANSTVPVGVVFEQSPSGGRRADKGSSVVLSVSTGPELAPPAQPPIVITPAPTASSTTSTSTTTTTTTTTTLAQP